MFPYVNTYPTTYYIVRSFDKKYLLSYLPHNEKYADCTPSDHWLFVIIINLTRIISEML